MEGRGGGGREIRRGGEGKRVGMGEGWWESMGEGKGGGGGGGGGGGREMR